MSSRARASALVAAIAVAAWWPGAWFARRVRWGLVEPYELVALGTLVILVALAARRRRAAAASAAAASAAAATARALAAAADTPSWRSVALGALANVAVGGLAAAATAVAVGAALFAPWVIGRGATLAVLALGLTALPLVPVLQLQLGYPLRVAAAELVAPPLEVAWPNLDVEARGGALVLRGAPLREERVVLVDEPCSGVRGLWLALYLGATLAALERLGSRRTALLLALGVVATLAANVARTFVLAALEVAREVPPRGLAPPWIPGARAGDALHSALGIGLAALVSAALVLAARRLAGARPAVPPAAEDALLAARPPGVLARFRTGRDQVVLAWVVEPTTDVHTAAVSYRGAGYRVTPLPARRGPDGGVWTSFRAARDGRAFVVRERVRTEGGRSFGDTGSWWWAATFGGSEGPFWRELVTTEE